jgi:hypothetical protein
MDTEETIRLYRDMVRAFHALGAVLYPDDTHRKASAQCPQQLLDACTGAMAALSIHKAQLEAEIGTDNL